MKEKINNLDISSILFLQLFSCSLGIAPYITIKITGIDAYISIIIGTIIGIIPILILIYIFNYEIDKPIHIKTKIIYGKTLGTIINIILTIIYIILTLTMLFNTSNFIISQYLTNTSITLVTLILGITIYHTVSKGITTISKISIIYTIIILSLLILGIIGIIPEIKPDNLKPILENGIKPPFLAALVYTLLLTSPAYSFLIIPKSIIENNKKTTNWHRCQRMRPRIVKDYNNKPNNIPYMHNIKFMSRKISNKNISIPSIYNPKKNINIQFHR